MPRRSKVDEMKYQNALRQKKHRAKQKALKEKNAFYTKCHASPGPDHVASPISSSYNYVMVYVFNRFEDQYRENYGKELPNPFYDCLLSADEDDDEVYVIRHFYEGIESDYKLPESVDETYVFDFLYPSLVNCVEILTEVSKLVYKSKEDLEKKIRDYEEQFKRRMAEDLINPKTIGKMEERELESRTSKVDKILK